MNEAVAAVLARIVASNGPEVYTDPRRVEELLRDVTGEHRREISVLSGAAREGIPAELVSQAGTVPSAILIERLARSLQDNLGLAEDAAEWAVATWASALSLDGLAGRAAAPAQEPGAHAPRPGEAAQPGHPQSFATSQLVVAMLGPADYRTIADAVAAAEPHARITVRPGIYREAVTISKPVELVADSPAGDVIIDATGGSCILMQADAAAVRGFTLRGTGSADSGFFGVQVTHGHLALEGCAISTNSWSCVAVHGVGASATIRNCQIHGSPKDGVSVFDHGTSVIEDCDIWDNENVGVYLSGAGSLTARRCKIHDNLAPGVVVDEQGAGVVEDCEISGNGDDGVHISDAQSLTARRCKIHVNQGSGVVVDEQGAGVVEDCEISGNAGHGVYITDAGGPTVKGCKIHVNQGSGVVVDEQGAGVVEDCEISGNGGVGVHISDAGSLTVRRCKIHDNTQAAGVSVSDRGAGVVEDCEIFGNPSGVGILGGNPVVRRCKIHDNQGFGVGVFEQGAGTFEDCEISGSKVSGVEIGMGGNPVFRRCKLHHSREAGGVAVYQQGAGTFEDCEIWGNKLHGVEISEGGNPVFRRCQIHGNQGVGVYALRKGAGTLENCVVRGNAGNPQVAIDRGCKTKVRN